MEEIGTLASALAERDTDLREAVDRVFEDLKSIDKIQRMARTLKLHLSHMRDRIERDHKYLASGVKNISVVVSEFRDRCKQDFTEFLKGLDYDLRKVLKPLVPTSAIEENVNMPPISSYRSLASSLNSSRESFDGESTTDKLTNHINITQHRVDFIFYKVFRVGIGRLIE